VPIVAMGLLIVIFGEKVEMVKEIKEQNLSIFKSLNTSDDFFNLFKKKSSLVFNDLNIERFCSLISLTISTFSPKIKINNPIATIGTKIPAPIKKISQK
jgi:hypothetical protein